MRGGSYNSCRRALLLTLNRRMTRSSRIVLTSVVLSGGMMFGTATTRMSTGSTETTSIGNHPVKYFFASVRWFLISSPVTGSGIGMRNWTKMSTIKTRLITWLTTKRVSRAVSKPMPTSKGVTKQVSARERERERATASEKERSDQGHPSASNGVCRYCAAIYRAKVLTEERDSRH